MKDVRGSYQLEITRVNTTTRGPYSFRYSAAKRWNDLNESLHALDNFKDFNDGFRILNFHYVCCKYC